MKLDILVASGLLLATPVLAAPQKTVRVAQTLNVSAGVTIQSVINQAADGDRILVAAGTYFESLDFMGKAITLIGAGGPSATTINAAGLGESVVYFRNGEGRGSILQGFTITGGDIRSGSSVGAGISAGTFLQPTSPTIRDCFINDNAATAGWGGGVWGDALLERCVISDNNAHVGGGVAGAPTLRYCVVAQNEASEGGGVAGRSSATENLTIEDCVIVENRCLDSARGGGIWVGWSSSATITRTVIAANMGDGFGFPVSGSGVYVESASSATVTSSSILDNAAVAAPFGGDVGGVYGPAVLVNTIVRGNSFAQTFGTTSASYSNIEGGLAGTGNIDDSPQFISAANRNYHMLAGSPGIDLGDPLLLDPDMSRSDIGAFPFATLYTRANTLPATWTEPSWPEISMLLGGRQVFGLTPGTSEAGKAYRVVGSFSGYAPGITLRAVHVALNPDSYTTYTLANPNTLPLVNFSGVLDASGGAVASIELASGTDPGLAGRTLHHVFGLFGSGGFESSSNWAPTTLVP